MSTDSTREFGIRVDGVTLLLPAGAALEYVAATPVYPLPGAGGRVIGLMQLRGYPIVVVDPGAGPPRPRGTIARADVVVIGTGSEAGALCVDAPPAAIEPGDVVRDARRPAAVFAQALGDALACPGGNPAAQDAGDASRTPGGAPGHPDGSLCWRFDPRRLFALLSAH